MILTVAECLWLAHFLEQEAYFPPSLEILMSEIRQEELRNLLLRSDGLKLVEAQCYSTSASQS